MSNRELQLTLRARADTKDLEKLQREIGDLVAALRRSGAAFDDSAGGSRNLTAALADLSREEQKQIQGAAQAAAAVERATAAKERAASAAASAASAQTRATQQVAVAEEKLAQERHKSFQAMARSEKAELDVAKAREQLRVATVRAEQAEKKATETKKSYGLATDMVRKQLAAFLTAGVAIQAGRQLVQFGRDTIEAASNVEEGAAKFQQVFRDMAGGVEDDLEKMAAANRRSIYDLKDFASELQNVFVPLGFAREQAAEMATTITQLGIDVAAFSNKADSDVIHNLTSALVGNHEAVRSYGIVLTESTIKQELMAMGASELTGQQLEVAKAQARLNLIMRSTADAQGAAVREADSYANTLKAWDAAVQDLKVSIGENLLPVMVDLINVAIQATEILNAGDMFRIPHENALQSAETVQEVVEAIRRSKQEMDDLDFWDWVKVNSTSWAGLDLAETQMRRIADLSGDVSEFQRTIQSEFSRIEITSFADELGVAPSWDLDQVTADIYKYIEALRAKTVAEAEAVEMQAAYDRQRQQILDASLELQTQDIAPSWVSDSRTTAVMAAWGAWADDLNAVAEASNAVAEAQARWNTSFAEGFQNAPVDALIQAQQELVDASGEWRNATIDNSTEIGAIQTQLAADLTSAQKDALQQQLKDLDEFSSEYMAIIGQLEGDLSDSQRFDLVKQLSELEGRQGQSTQFYTGDLEAAEQAKQDIIAANEAITQSHYDRAYNTIAARMIEAGEYEKLAELAVNLGIMTEDEAALRLEYAQTVAALDALTASTEFYGLTALQQSGAVKSLALGIYDTADAAIAAQNALKATQDFYATAPDSTAISNYYTNLANQTKPTEGITTTVSVLVDPATQAEFIGFRGELEEYDTNIYQTQIDADALEAKNEFESIRTLLGDLTEEPWIIKVKYETEGAPTNNDPPPGNPPRSRRSGGRGGAGSYIDLTVNNYGGQNVAGAVQSGVLAALRSLG